MAYDNNKSGKRSNAPTHVMMLSGKRTQSGRDWNGKPIYPVKMYVNLDKDNNGEKFSWRVLDEFETNEEKLGYILEHIVVTGATRPKHESARDQTHPIDMIKQFIDEDLGSHELSFRIMRQRPYDGHRGGSGRGGSYDGRDRDREQDDYDDRPRRRGDRDDDRERDGRHSRDDYDDRPRSRGDRDGGRGESRSHRFDPPDRDDRDFSRDDDDPFTDGN